MKHVILLALLCSCGPATIEGSGGDFYEDIAVAICDRSAECGLISFSEVPQCVDVFVNELCAADLGACAANYEVPATEWEQCLEEYESHACNSVEAGVLPSECVTIDELILRPS